MRTETCLLKLCFLAVTILSANLVNAQLPSRDNFNFIFENNYNDDKTGEYLASDFIKDWNKESGGPEGNIDIINENGSNQTFMRAYYPTGTISPSKTHGFTWYSYLPTKGEEIYFSYDIRFKPGFQWVHGGKIPGLMGGSVTSGQDPSLNNGFNARMMWKGGGSLVFYIYHYDQTNIYGDTYFWEGFKFETGKWYNLTIRLVLNSIVDGKGIANGILEGYVDGKLIFQKTDFRFRMNDRIKIERMYICSFFGGSTEDWAAARDEWIDTDNYLCFTYSDKASNVPRGFQKNTTKTLLHPYLAGEEVVETPEPEILQSPSQLMASNMTSTSIDLNWTDNSGKEDGFLLDRSLSRDGGFKQVASCGPNETSCTDGSLEPGVTYYYRLRAFNSTGYSEYSNVVGTSTLKPENPDIIQNKTVYIDPETDGDHSDGTLNHPFDSWSKVTWKPGYTYLQKRGTISTVGTLQIGASNIKIGSYGEGNLPVIKSETTTYLISGFEKSYVTISDLNLQADNAISCMYFLGDSGDSIIVERCTISGNVNAIKILDGVNFIARYNSINSQQEGIFSTASDNKVYYNNFIACNTAVNIMGNSSRSEIFNNVFTDNTRSVSVSNGELNLYNNIFYLTAPNQKALIQGTGKISSDCNIFYPEQDGFISVDGKNFNKLNDLKKSLRIDAHSISSDPEFVDIEKRNFQLLSSSPAINTGKNTASVSEDMAGTKVPLFGKTDIGAYEFDGNISDSDREEAGVTMKVYPNPSIGPVSIEINIPDEQLIKTEFGISLRELKVTDIAGKTLIHKKMNWNGNSTLEDHLDLSDLKEGLYFIIVQLADQVVKEKVVVTR